MRLLMMGTGPFAVPALVRLCQSTHEVAQLVTRPDRGRHAPANPMRDAALRLGIPVHDPADANAPEARRMISELAPDLLVVCDFGQILSPQTLACARLGGINLHGSLLPKYRGAAPIQWAIYHGESETGVSVIHLTPRLDAGPVIAQQSTPIGPEETADSVELRLAEIGADLVAGAVDALAAGTARPIDQDPAQATRAPRIVKSDGQIDWSRTAVEIHRHIRAMQPWPRTFTFLHRAGVAPMRLIVNRAQVADASAGAPSGASPGASPSASAVPGTVVAADKKKLLVATGEGVLSLSRVVPPGKRDMAVDEFLRGHKISPGARFTSEEHPNN